MPFHQSNYKLLFPNLIYTGITRAKKLACIVGDINALRHAIETNVTDKRMTGLQEWLRMKLPILSAYFPLEIVTQFTVPSACTADRHWK